MNKDKSLLHNLIKEYIEDILNDEIESAELTLDLILPLIADLPESEQNNIRNFAYDVTLTKITARTTI